MILEIIGGLLLFWLVGVAVDIIFIVAIGAIYNFKFDGEEFERDLWLSVKYSWFLLYKTLKNRDNNEGET